LVLRQAVAIFSSRPAPAAAAAGPNDNDVQLSWDDGDALTWTFTGAADLHADPATTTADRYSGAPGGIFAM